jgi:hypothetical protein
MSGSYLRCCCSYDSAFFTQHSPECSLGGHQISWSWHQGFMPNDVIKKTLTPYTGFYGPPPLQGTHHQCLIRHTACVNTGALMSNCCSLNVLNVFLWCLLDMVCLAGKHSSPQIWLETPLLTPLSDKVVTLTRPSICASRRYLGSLLIQQEWSALGQGSLSHKAPKVAAHELMNPPPQFFFF